LTVTIYATSLFLISAGVVQEFVKEGDYLH